MCGGGCSTRWRIRVRQGAARRRSQDKSEMLRHCKTARTPEGLASSSHVVLGPLGVSGIINE